MHQLKLSMIDIFVEKDGDDNSPGEVNFVLYAAGQEIARTNWAWPIYDGGRRAYGTDVFLNTDQTNLPIRFDVHEDDDWPEKDDYASTTLNIDLINQGGRRAWKIRAVSSNQKLVCTLSFLLEVVSELPEPQTIMAYEHIDARGKSANLLDARFAKKIAGLHKDITLYQINCADLNIGNDQLSSLYIPKANEGEEYQITLFEHAPNDPNFLNGQRYDPFYFRSGLVNLTELKAPQATVNINDMISYIEIKHIKDKKIKKVIKVGQGK